MSMQLKIRTCYLIDQSHLYAILIVLGSWLVAGCDDAGQPMNELPAAGTSSAGINSPGRSQAQLSVTRPQVNEILAMSEVVVEGTHATAPEVNVNGVRVPVVNQRFTTSLSLSDGPQQVVVIGGEDRATINILVDTVLPEVRIIEPTYGTHIDSSLFFH